MWASSTPLPLFTKIISPAPVIEQLHMLCCWLPSCFIISSTQITSASLSSSHTALGFFLSAISFSFLIWPSFLPPARALVLKPRTSPLLLTSHSRFPSTNGAQHKPSSGQSLTRPVGSFSLLSCQSI